MTKPFKILIGVLTCTGLMACSTSSTNAPVPDVESRSDEVTLSDADGGKSVPPPSEAPSSEHYRRFNEARLSKNFKLAQEIGGEILARQPNDLRILNALGIMAIEQNKLSLARLLIGKVLAKEPSNSAAQNNLGLIELKSGNLRLALSHFKKSIEINPSNRSARANLGQIYLSYRNYTAAAAELESAVRSGDESVETLSNWGVALSRTGQSEQAIEAFEKALKKNEGNAVVQLNYAVLLLDQVNRPKKALKFLNKIRSSSTDPAIIEKAIQMAKRAEAAAKGSTEKGESE
ncbi:MAG: tetratricopeptide repeat protein [Oligoflexia bacterium]|nr:tetratricopeptide repeat protein [Oligoflexia bacterium]